MFDTFFTTAEYVNEEDFYKSIREYIISLLTFICVYFMSYLFIGRFKRKIEQSDYEDDLVYRVSIWLCCFTMTVSIGAVLLLPFSIFSNEILLSYQSSFYMKWLNDSLIHGLWNQIFLGTYIAMFLAMPFAYFFTESEGFAGSRKGIKSRIYETFVVLFLLLVLVSSFVWVFLAFMSPNKSGWLASVSETWMPPLPFIYSCISLFGALLLLICTPLGFATLFTILGNVIVRPKFFIDLDDQIQALYFEQEEVQRKLTRSLSYIGLNTGESKETLEHRLHQVKEKRLKLERERDASVFEKTLLYPLCLLALLAATAVCLLMVAVNSFRLVFGQQDLPFTDKYPSLGKMSISKLGWFGILLQIFLIFYILTASVVGFYSSPFFIHLRPRVKNTSTTTLIANCIIFLVFSSALPVLVRTLGITSFNLMGEFGRLDWLGNYELVLFYNLLFEASTSFCLVNKFTKSVRDALYEQFKYSSLFKFLRRKVKDN